MKDTIQECIEESVRMREEITQVPEEQSAIDASVQMDEQSNDDSQHEKSRDLLYTEANGH